MAELKEERAALEGRRGDAYEQSVRLPITDVTTFLLESLGRGLVMELSKSKDATAVGGWASGDRRPRMPVERRLRTAYQAFVTISDADSVYSARAWFIGLNPQLDDTAPITVIGEDRLKDALVAARSFVQTS